MRPFCRISVLAGMAVGGASLPAQSYHFTTIVGYPPTGAFADGTGAAARFKSPQAAAFDRAGNLFVADTNNHVIRKVTAAGEVTTFAGRPGVRGGTDGLAESASFSSPAGVAVDAAGNVFVSDTGNHLIRMVSPQGSVSSVAGAPGAAGNRDGVGVLALFHSPGAIAIDPSGVLYVVDTGNAVIRKIAPGNVVTTIPVRLVGPRGVAVDAAGNVYVSDNDHFLRRISPGGGVTLVAGNADSLGFGPTPLRDGVGTAARFIGMYGLAMTPSGNVLVADSWLIRSVTPAGVVTTLAGPLNPASAARFVEVTGIAVNQAGTIVVVDRGEHTIRRIATSGIATTIAGVAGIDGPPASLAGAVRLSEPSGIAVDRAGVIYIADTSNDVIRIFDGRGVVTRTGGDIPFARPTGVAVDAAGNVIVADHGTAMIRKIDPAGAVTTVAGARFSSGDADGPGALARFRFPHSVAVDAAGVIYVSDSENHVVRKILPSGDVSTLAGKSRESGWADGRGAEARFASPRGIAVDAAGIVYVVDSSNSTVRKITPDGSTSTLAGAVRAVGSNDGTRNAARFAFPEGLALDAGGNLIIADRGNDTLRKVTPGGVVSTIGGVAGDIGFKDGTGAQARFSRPSGVAMDATGTLFVADNGNNVIRKGVIEIPPLAITTPPASRHVQVGQTVTLTVSTQGDNPRYQWRRNSVDLPGATGFALTIAGATADHAGIYSVVVSSEGQRVESSAAIVTVATGRASRLSNVSTRALVPAGGALTVGFVVRGPGDKQFVARGVGPALSSLGVAGVLENPRLEIIRSGGSSAQLANDDWDGTPTVVAAFAGVGAFPLRAASRDAAVLGALPAAAYSVRVSSTDPTGSGVVLAELYDRDLTSSQARLVNLSTLGWAGLADQRLVSGVVITPGDSKRLLIRAVGPGLLEFGVPGTLSDPRIEIAPLGMTLVVGANDDSVGDIEVSTAARGAGAFALPTASRDAALVVRLPAGAYTIMVSGAENATGMVLLEVYDLDP